MIKVNYLGRLGNNLFQYATGRLLAEELGYKLVVKTFPEFKNMTELPGLEITAPVFTLRYLEGRRTSSGYADPEYTIDSLAAKAPCKFILNAFCHRADVLLPHQDKLRIWYDIENAYKPNPDDIVLHVRLTDFVPLKRTQPEQYYLNILKLRSWRKKYICTDDRSHALIKHLCSLGCELVEAGNVFSDFRLIKSFNNIAVASSFSWWAALLSDAERVYLPQAMSAWALGWHQFDGKRGIYV